MLLMEPDDHPLTDVEKAIAEQKYLKPVPFPGMDKTGRGVCVEFNGNGSCKLGELCPLRHIRKYKRRLLVCRHWLRGLCKSGDNCEFLHEYIPSLMPECVFFAREQQCNNPDCEFRHVQPGSKAPAAVMEERSECLWYRRGFCRHGPHCPLPHVRCEMCPYYSAGFCPSGPSCKLAHPSFELPVPPIRLADIACFNCHERGHKMVDCPTLPGRPRGEGTRMPPE